MKYTIIAPAGENLDALYASVSEFTTEKFIIVSTKETMNYAKQAQSALKKFAFPVELVERNGEIMEAMFQAIAEIRETEKGKNLLINASTGTTETNCAAICAGYVNGLNVFVVEKDRVKLLPIMKFSYYKAISERKLEILNALASKTCHVGLIALAGKTKMALPLLSYHINGNVKAEGLTRLGLVETHNIKGKMEVCLTLLGKLLLRGYIPHG